MHNSQANQSRTGARRIVVTTSVSELEDEIEHLRDLDLPGLRARWHSVFRSKAPDHLPCHLLYRMIAYGLQAERLGDLDRDTERFRDRVAVGTRNRDELPVGNLRRHGLRAGSWCGSGMASPARHTLGPGIHLERYDLSQPDRDRVCMTYTQWSGPRFFGIRTRGEKPA
jgi:hypothetical protein